MYFNNKVIILKNFEFPCYKYNELEGQKYYIYPIFQLTTLHII